MTEVAKPWDKEQDLRQKIKAQDRDDPDDAVKSQDFVKHEFVNAKWYAIYTRPRWEKKVNTLLLQKGIESYCPLNKVKRKWSDRVKTVEEPLFKSYVFVKIDEERRTLVRMTNGVVNFVYWNGKPAVIKEKEIQTIKRFLDEYENVEVQKMDFQPDERVKIVAGPMMDQEGKVVEIKNKIAKVCIDSLGYLLIANIDKTKLVPAPTKQNS